MIEWLLISLIIAKIGNFKLFLMIIEGLIKVIIISDITLYKMCFILGWQSFLYS